ncbi:MAG: hypothetical protein ABIQ44_08330 [Chloroflexia bacterium]
MASRANSNLPWPLAPLGRAICPTLRTKSEISPLDEELVGAPGDLPTGETLRSLLAMPEYVVAHIGLARPHSKR